MSKDTDLLQKALDHAVRDDVLTDSEADHLYTQYVLHIENAD